MTTLPTGTYLAIKMTVGSYKPLLASDIANHRHTRCAKLQQKQALLAKCYIGHHIDANLSSDHHRMARTTILLFCLQLVADAGGPQRKATDYGPISEINLLKVQSR